MSENSAPVLVDEAGVSLRARIPKNAYTNIKHKSSGNVASGLVSAFGAKIKGLGQKHDKISLEFS